LSIIRVSSVRLEGVRAFGPVNQSGGWIGDALWHRAGQRRRLTLKWRKLASVCARQDEHPLDVPGHGHDTPLAAHIVEATQQELAEAKHRFDDTEHRFGRLYRQSASRNTELLMFSDGANDCLFDATNERTVLMYGRSKTTPPNSRDTPYHQGYPRAGDGYDKGHALSHAQGGLEGCPNYFKQKRNVNQRRSGAGNLWRDIETYLAANAGVFAFVRLIYRPGETSEMPFEAEYGILNWPGHFRVVIFPNR
jgi:hypothetical protein